MGEVLSDPNLVAHCGLYCGACGKYLKDKCPGCHANEGARWCKIRSCCRDSQYASCAECTEFQNPGDCAKFNNFFSKMFGLIFRSDRAACIERIRSVGIEAYADYMSENGLQSIKR
jgi:hypothetical protein